MTPASEWPIIKVRTRLEVFVFGKLGMPELLVLLVIALLIFGPGKLADFGKGLGEGIRNFKGAIKDGESSSNEAEKK